jgi:putative MATE family efflux protein
MSSPLPPLCRDPVGRTLISLALPSMWGVLAVVAANVVDTLFAKHLGLNAQAALAFTAPVAFMLSSLALGLAVGTASLVARTMGAGDRDAVKRISGQALLMAFAVVTLVGLVGIAAIHPLFRALGAPDALLPLIDRYMTVYLLGSAALVLPMVGSAVLRACGNTVAPSLVLTLIAFLKFLVTPALMFGWGPLPRLELTGAALGTLIAFSGGTLLTFAYLKRDGVIRFTGLAEAFRPTMAKVLVIGLPSALTNILGPVCIALATKLIAPLGEATVAGFGIATRIEALVLIPAMALSGVVGPFIGQNLGAGRGDRMLEGMRLVVLFCLGYGLFVALVLGLGAGLAAGVFTADAGAIQAAKLYLWIVPLSFALYNVIMVASGAFNGLGDPRGNLAFYGTKTVVFIGGVLIGDALGGYAGVCIGIAAANVAGGLLALLWLRTKFVARAPVTAAA